MIALGEARAGSEAFYANLLEKYVAVEDLACVSNSDESSEITPGTNTDSDDTAADNLDYLIDLLSEHDDLMKEVSELCYSFVEDVSKRTKQIDIQYLLGLKKFFSIYLDTVCSTEPQLSATPKLRSLLHTYFTKK